MIAFLLYQEISLKAIRNNKKPEEIDDEKILDEVAEYLARGINNALAFWSSDVVVLGGSLVKKISISNVKSHLKKYGKDISFPASYKKRSMWGEGRT